MTCGCISMARPTGGESVQCKPMLEMRPGPSGSEKIDISWVGFVVNVIHFTYKL